MKLLNKSAFESEIANARCVSSVEVILQTLEVFSS